MTTSLREKMDGNQSPTFTTDYDVIWTGSSNTVPVDFVTYGEGYYLISNLVLMYLTENKGFRALYAHSGVSGSFGNHYIYEFYATWTGTGWNIRGKNSITNSAAPVTKIEKLN
jgi:hypothetical protein